jgi:hypothetical protein
MPRRRRVSKRHSYNRVALELSIGPFMAQSSRTWRPLRCTGACTVTVLLEEYRRRHPGLRPWGWWQFEAVDFDAEDGEEGERGGIDARDEAQLRYLAERGHLSPDELAAIYEAESEFKASYPPGADRDNTGRLFYGATAADEAHFGVMPALRDARVVREAMAAKRDEARWT